MSWVRKALHALRERKKGKEEGEKRREKKKGKEKDLKQCVKALHASRSA
jgi:hypothetical protein